VKAGTAGVTAGLPFTGDDEASFAFCDEDEPPTTAGGWEPVATIGAWVDFLGAPAAEAYEAVVAGVVFAGIGFCWLAGDVIRGVRFRSFAMRESGCVWIFFFVGVEEESGIDGAGGRDLSNCSKLQRGNKNRQPEETHKCFPLFFFFKFFSLKKKIMPQSQQRGLEKAAESPKRVSRRGRQSPNRVDHGAIKE